MHIDSFLTSGIAFDESEDLLAFRFGFLNTVMLTSALFSALFVAVDLATLNALGTWQLRMTVFNLLGNLLLVGALRYRKRRFAVIACAFAAIHFVTFTSALISVTGDEFRLIWFYIEVVVVYILLGQRAGLLATLLSLVTILLAIHVLNVPISRNAETTSLISLCASSAIVWAYTSRATLHFEKLIETNRKLRELATLDPLTGLLNPRAYYDIVNRMIRLAHRDKTPFSVLFVDIDHFKAINDRHGHASGDLVLRAVAECLNRNLRNSDIVGRIGGEEFVVYLPETDLAGATKLGESIRHAIEMQDIHLPEQPPTRITASVGIARNQPEDRTAADIQRRADRAMYRAKDLGRNRVEAFEEEPRLAAC